MGSNNKTIIILITSLIFLLMSTTNACAYVSYNVKKGDSLFKLSHRFDTSISSISQMNNIQNPNLIYANQKLKVPDSSTTSNYSSSNYKSSSNKSISNFKSSNQTQASSNHTTWQENSIFTARPKTNLQKEKQIYRKNPEVKQIALTFDDGPDQQYTPQILQVLDKYNAKATFFLLGKASKKYPQVTKQIIKAGHTIGNHSWSHADLTSLNKAKLAHELNDTTRLLKEITNSKTKLLRPPYGKISSELLTKLETTDYKIIHWSIDSLDWKAQSKQEIINRVLPKIKQGAIILFHSAGGPTQDLTPTIKALPAIIKAIRSRGIKLVTVDKLLSLPAYG